MRAHTLLLVLSVLTACSKKDDAGANAPAASPPPVPTTPRPLGFADLEAMAPATLLGLTRERITPIADVQLISVRYAKGAQILDLNINLINDLPASKDFYEVGYKDRAQVAGQTVFMRHWTEDSGRTTAEACVILRDRLNVTVGLSPGKDRDALPFLEALDLAELDRRAAVK